MSTIRPVRAEDIPNIVKLVHEAGFPVRSPEGWQWALFDNPDQGELAPGLIAECDGQIVAMIGTQARRFLVDGNPQAAICGHTLISLARGHGAGRALSQHVLEIPGMAAAYTLNNNALSAPLYKKLGLKAWLGSAGRGRMEWPVRPLTVAAGLLLTRLARHEAIYDRLSLGEHFPPPSAQLAPPHDMADSILWLDPDHRDHATLIGRLDADVCEARPAAPVRSARMYAWQMSDPDAPGRTALLGMCDADTLTGLMQVTLTKPNSFEPAELDILDLVSHPRADAERIIPALINAARSLARQTGLARVRLPFAGRFDQACFAGTGLRFKRQHAYDSAHAIFSNPDGDLAHSWAPTGFESDMFFALRTLPGSAGPEIGPAPQQEFERTAGKKQSPQA